MERGTGTGKVSAFSDEVFSIRTGQQQGSPDGAGPLRVFMFARLDDVSFATHRITQCMRLKRRLARTLRSLDALASLYRFFE